jgi:hypothetical protein
MRSHFGQSEDTSAIALATRPALASQAPLRSGSGRLRLLDSPTDDGVTAQRAEIKFALRQSDIGKVRNILEVNCRRIVYNRVVSEVNSIYFDNCLMTGAQENLGGADRRTKLRLRWYDLPLPGTRAFLEVKRRHGRMIGKDRMAIDSQVPLAELTYDEIRTGLCEILPPRFGELLMLRPEAVLVNSYRREHFAVPGSPTRITIDYDIVSYAQSGYARPHRHFGVPLGDLIVIEGKAPRGSETELRGILYPLKLRVTRCSKYVQGCQALGLADDNAGITDD